MSGNEFFSAFPNRQHKLLLNLTFVSEMIVITYHEKLLLVMFISLHWLKDYIEGCLEYKSSKNVVLAFLLFSGVIKWHKLS